MRACRLLEAAAAASRLLRRSDGPAHPLIPLRRALTADAAESVHQEEQQQQQQQQQQSPSSSNAADAEDDEFDSARARRLREMEASTSSVRGDVQIQTAAQVSTRLRSEQRSGGEASIRSPLSPSSLLRSPDASEKSDRSVQPTVRDWRDALEAAKMLEPGGDPLTDSFGRRHTYLRISLTERCNLRCTYCMPPDGVDLTPNENLLSTPELARLAGLFASLGVRKVRLTGGEPTLRPDLPQLARAIASQPGIDTVGLTTNGVSLGAGGGKKSSNVDARVAALRDAGVTSLNVSLDTLRPERFERLARRPAAGHAAALAAIESASRLGLFRDVMKVNVVVMRGVNDDEVGDFSEWALRSGVNVRFIEFMPFEANAWSTKKVVSYAEMLQAAREGVAGLGELVPYEEGEEKSGAATVFAKRRHYDGVAKDFVLSSPSSSSSSSSSFPGSRPGGIISFITSMTSPFCSSCTRLRLLADGNLKVCLLGGAEVSLRDAARGGCSDAELSLLVRGALANKRAAHAGMRELEREGREGVGAGRAMVRIGG